MNSNHDFLTLLLIIRPGSNYDVTHSKTFTFYLILVHSMSLLNVEQSYQLPTNKQFYFLCERFYNASYLFKTKPAPDPNSTTAVQNYSPALFTQHHTEPKNYSFNLWTLLHHSKSLIFSTTSTYFFTPRNTPNLSSYARQHDPYNKSC